MRRKKYTVLIDERLIDVLKPLAEGENTTVNAWIEQVLISKGKSAGLLPRNFETLKEGRGGSRPSTYRIDTLNIESTSDLQAMLKLQKQYRDADQTIKQAEHVDLDKVKAAYAMFVPYLKVVRVRGRIVGAVGMFRASESAIATLKINPAVEPDLRPEPEGEFGYISGFNVLAKHCRNMRVMRLMREATIALVEESGAKEIYAYPASDEGRRLLVDYGFTALSDNPKGLYVTAIASTYPRKKHRGN